MHTFKDTLLKSLGGRMHVVLRNHASLSASTGRLACLDNLRGVQLGTLTKHVVGPGFEPLPPQKCFVRFFSPSLPSPYFAPSLPSQGFFPGVAKIWSISTTHIPRAIPTPTPYTLTHHHPTHPHTHWLVLVRD